MNRGFRFSLVTLFFCLAAALPAGGRRDNQNAAGDTTVTQSQEQSTVVRVSGRLRLVGNEPMTELVISESDREWYIDRSEKQKLMDLQQRTITVEGIETVRELRFANGNSAGTRRTLRDIKIISVE